MKKYITASVLSGFMGLTCFSAPVSAELSTQVIYTTNLPGSGSNNGGGPFLKADGNTVAWTEHSEVVFWDGQAIQRIGFANNVTSILDFSISDGQIAWVGKASHQESGYSVFFWDGTYDAQNQPYIQRISYLTLLESTVGLAWGVSLNHGQIAWNDSDGNDWEIYLWDGTYNNSEPNITQITDNSDYDVAPSLADGQIAWRGGPSGYEQYVRYWDGSAVHELSGERTLYYMHTVRNSNGAMAWLSYPMGDIRYWDGTFSGGNPNIVTAAQGSYGTLTNPSLHNGKISYIRRDGTRPTTEDEAVFYWNGADTTQLSEWFDWASYGQMSYRDGAQVTSDGVFYVGVNATSNLREIRFVTSTGFCL